MKLRGADVRVLHFGRAHTGGDSVVYFPDVKVVATSDAVTTGTQGPLADYAGGGSFAEWTPVLDAMLKLEDQLLMQLKTDDIGWAPRVPQIDPFYEELSKKK